MNCGVELIRFIVIPSIVFVLLPLIFYSLRNSISDGIHSLSSVNVCFLWQFRGYAIDITNQGLLVLLVVIIGM
ncbi:MAG: hypothetical protein ACTHKJ_05970 [Candidatus Nitrosocosmicus sp.]